MASIKVGAGSGTEEIESEMDGWWERKDHPLLNDVVLKILFESMSVKDLKQCRLVCKKWCVLTLAFTRSKFNIKLNGNGAGSPRSVTDFVQVFKENKLGIPFAKYTLAPFCTTEGPGQEFIKICGNTAKMVYLYQLDPPGLEIEISQIGGSTVKTVYLRQQEPHVFTVEVGDIGALLKAMPNIEVFGISHRIHSRSGNVVKLFHEDSANKPALNFLKTLLVYDYHRTNDYCPTFIEEIFSVAPNVSDYHVRDSGSIKDYDSKESRVGQVLRAIEKFDRASVIKNLDFANASTDHFDSLRRLAENGLKLKKLDFLTGNYGNDEDMPEILPQLAKLFKNSIERLCVDEVCSSFIKLPHMPKLKRLDFHISKDFDSKSVNLNKLFPALKAMELNFRDWHRNLGFEWEEFLPNSEPCPNLKSLRLEQVVVRTQLFDHILNTFPKLTKLELDVESDGVVILRKIMTQMTQLEDLRVSGRIEAIESIDALCTGIPLQRIQELENVVTELKEMTVQPRAETIRHYRTQFCNFPSIANLTNLKRLFLNIIGRCDEQEGEPREFTRMTDVFAFFCLYSMKHINKLEIENCEFTKATCEILTVEMELESWGFVDDCVHIIPARPRSNEYE